MQRGIAAQRRHRGHQLEGRTRRILAVARAIQQFVRRGRRGARAGRSRRRARSPSPAHRPSPPPSPPARRWRSGLPQVALQNLLRPQLQPDVHREPHVAVARQQSARLPRCPDDAGSGSAAPVRRTRSPAAGDWNRAPPATRCWRENSRRCADRRSGGRSPRRTDSGGCRTGWPRVSSETPSASYSASRCRSSSCQLLVASGTPLRS